MFEYHFDDRLRVPRHPQRYLNPHPWPGPTFQSCWMYSPDAGEESIPWQLVGPAWSEIRSVREDRTSQESHGQMSDLSESRPMQELSGAIWPACDVIRDRGGFRWSSPGIPPLRCKVPEFYQFQVNFGRFSSKTICIVQVYPLCPSPKFALWYGSTSDRKEINEGKLF